MENKATEWVKFDGSDEQIAEIMCSKNGFIVDSQWSVFSEPNKLKIALDDQANIDWLKQNFEDYDVTKYWIIPADPLREMKIRQAQTGQPVWIRMPGYEAFPSKYETYWWNGRYTQTVTTRPDWNIPNAEYRLSPFED